MRSVQELRRTFWAGIITLGHAAPGAILIPVLDRIYRDGANVMGIEMIGTWGRAKVLFALILAAGCADVTMPETESRSAGPTLAGATYLGDVYVLPPVTVTVPPGCDPWMDINWCQGSGPCASSMDPAGHAVSASCLGGGEGPVLGGGGGGTGGDGGGSTEGIFTGPAAEGPIAWAICVLTVLNITSSVHDVAVAFEAWWSAQLEYESTLRMLDALRANPGSVTPEMEAVWMLRVDFSRAQRDDAREAVRSLTGSSLWSLVLAGGACGAAAILPLP